MLVGATSKLQYNNKHLQNQLYIQQDRSNYLNLHLGGVQEIEGKSCKHEVVEFFKDILEIPDVTTSNFVRAYRKTNPTSYTEEIRDGSNSVKLKINAPGLMFVRLSSEQLRELAVSQARKLGGRLTSST